MYVLGAYMLSHFILFMDILFRPFNVFTSIFFIIWFFNLSTSSVPEEGYSERTWRRLFWAYLMKVILSVSDEGYSARIWWRLFWAYLMKVIPETLRVHYIWYHVLIKGDVDSKLTSSYKIRFFCIHDMAVA